MMITLKDFQRIDLRVGQIISAELIPSASRLLRIQVDLGQEQRNLVAALSAHYAPGQLVGLKVVVVANLKPANIHGILSEGMMLGAGCSDGQEVALLTINKDVMNGTPVE